MTTLIDKTVSIEDCPSKLRRVLHRVFQGINVGKAAGADSAAELFNQAFKQGNNAMLKLIAFGLQAVKCYAINRFLHLVLKPIESDNHTITICGSPAAFVAK